MLVGGEESAITDQNCACVFVCVGEIALLARLPLTTGDMVRGAEGAGWMLVTRAASERCRVEREERDVQGIAQRERASAERDINKEDEETHRKGDAERDVMEEWRKGGVKGTGEIKREIFTPFICCPRLRDVC